MTPDTFPFGFRVAGDLYGPRRLVDAAAAFRGHCAALPTAEPGRECYLSAFLYGPEFVRHLEARREGQLDEARQDACHLTAFLDDRYPELEPLVFFSGFKGFAVLMPLAHRPAGGSQFHRVARRLAETLAARRGVTIDSSLYDRVRPFRAPNSRHPRTGLHKVRVELDCLMHRDAEAICEWARVPRPFDPPDIPPACPQLAADWAEAERAVAAEDRGRPAFVPTPGGRLAQATMDLMRNGCEKGERHTRLFRAAGNMAECGGTPPLIHAILDEVGTDLGLSVADARRQVDCGIARTLAAAGQSAVSDERGAA